METFVLLFSSSLPCEGTALWCVSESAASGGTGRAREALGVGNSLGSSSLPLSVLHLNARSGLTLKLFLIILGCFSGASMTRLDFGAAASC
jgi:hypothetical protein